MTDTSKRELIEEAASLIHRNYSETAWADVSYTDRVWAEGTARKVLAVFEQAHTPTDDEREDMIAWLLRDHGNDLSPLGRNYTDAEIAAALRRTAVQEPSAEPTVRDHVRSLTGATDAELDELGGLQGEPTDAQVDAAYLAWNGARIEGGHTGFTAMHAALCAAYEEGKKR